MLATAEGFIGGTPQIRTMRALYLTPGCFDKGGISRYNRYQIASLRELLGEDNVDVLSLLGPGEDSFEAPIDVRFTAGGLSRRQKAAFLREACIAALRGPQLILAAHVNMSALAVALARRPGARSIVNIYGLEVWSGLRRDARWGLERVSHVISDCGFTATWVEQEGLRPPKDCEVIWDCVDIERFHVGVPRPDVLERYNVPSPATGQNLLTLGRMSADALHKGYDRLLEVFARVAPRVPSLRLIYAGRGSLVDVLRDQARDLGLADRVFFTGMVHEDHLVDIYRSAHIFSLVSDRGPGRGEGLPLTPLEASACGVPILVGNQDGSAEAVVASNGFVLDPFDLDAHAAKIELLATSEDTRRAMGDAAALAARREFSYEGFRKKHHRALARWFPDVQSFRWGRAAP